VILCLQEIEEGIKQNRLRGGCWINNPHNCRSANRNNNNIGRDNINNNIGFRVVCVASSTPKNVRVGIGKYIKSAWLGVQLYSCDIGDNIHKLKLNRIA
jgi:hypothetical protein